MRKIHMIPPSSSAKWTLCGIPAQTDGTRVAITTRREFSKLHEEDRCGRCETVLNGGRERLPRLASGRDQPGPERRQRRLPVLEKTLAYFLNPHYKGRLT